MENKETIDATEDIKSDHTQVADAEVGEESISISESTNSMMSSPRRKQLMMAVNTSLQSIDPQSLLKPVEQSIQCTGDDNQSSFPIYGNEVNIFPCELGESYSPASSKIRVSQVCKFDWEQRYYFGELIAANKTYVAYVVGAVSSKNEHVRVINHKTSSRVLLKGFEGKVTSIMFRGPDDSHLACMDMIGSIRVFLIFEENGELKFKQVVEFLREDMYRTEFSLVSWAPSLLDDASDEEECSDLILAITHSEKAEVLSIRTILEQGEENCFIEGITRGKKSIHNGHTQPITQLAIAPNFEALATSSLDGFVKVWNISFDEEEDPRCLHEWRPHNGEPVTALVFCDNQLAEGESISSWRFLITGTKYNSEIKVWCSVSWTCLQTLRFCASPKSTPSEERNPFPRLKPLLDKSATFFVLSDIKRQVLYVLQLFQDSQEGTCHFTSLTEFILTQPMLSYSLYQSKAVKKVEGDLEVADEDEVDDKDVPELERNGISIESADATDSVANDTKNAYQVSLKMFGIQYKALQKLHIRYTPYCSVHPPTPSVCTAVSSEDYLSARDAMSDITDTHGGAVSDHEDADSFASANLKVSSMKESADSSVSTLTTISVDKSSLAAENDEANGGGEVVTSNEGNIARGKSDDIVAGSQCDVAKEEDVSVHDKATKEAPETVELPRRESPVKVYPVQEVPERESTAVESPLNESQTRESYSKESSVKNTPGTITILKRSDKIDQHVQESTEDSTKRSYSASAESKSKDKRNQKKTTAYSKLESEKLMTQLEASSSSGKSTSAADEKDVKIKANGKQSDEDDICSLLSFTSTSKSSLDVQTGDLLGLGFIGSVPSEEKKPAYQESIQPTGLILKMLQDQQKNIVQLTRTVQDLSSKLSKQMEINEKLSKQQHDEHENAKASLQVMQKTSISVLNKLSKDISKTCSQRIDSMSSSVQVSLDNQMQAMFQGINSTIGTKLDKSIKSEFKSSLIPNALKPINTAMDRVSSLFSTRLEALEKVLREEMAALIKSKSMVESIGFSATEVLEGILPNAYRKAFETVLIPSYERSCNEMFSQISKEFEKGTRNYFQKMDGYFEARRQKQSDSRDPVLKQMQDLSQTFQDTADRLTGIERNLEILMQKQISDAFHKFKNELSASLEKTISKSLFGSFKETIDSSFSQMKIDLTSFFQGMAGELPVTEVSMENRMEKIDMYLHEFDYCRAFEEALNAVDLTYVLHVCQRVDAEELFSKKGGCLEQPIILSLIQQLSIDLASETELKVNYLSEAIEALDKEHEITAAHMTAVLDSLSEQVDSAIVLLKSSDEPNKQHQQQLSMLGKLIRAKHR